LGLAYTYVPHLAPICTLCVSSSSLAPVMDNLEQFLAEGYGMRELPLLSVSNLEGEYSNLILESAPVGSRVTCNPPPQNTDEDYLWLVSDLGLFDKNIRDDGFLIDGSEAAPLDEEGDVPYNFVSVTNGNKVNIIATDSQEFFDKFMLATHVATRLNLLEKKDRIVLFQAILYGNKVI
jgi:hypothetical protein